MVGHACLAYDEAGNCICHLARVEQASRRGEIKGAAWENRTPTDFKRKLISREKERLFSDRKRGFAAGVIITCLCNKVNGRLRAVSHRGVDESVTRLNTVTEQASELIGLRVVQLSACSKVHILLAFCHFNQRSEPTGGHNNVVINIQI